MKKTIKVFLLINLIAAILIISHLSYVAYIDFGVPRYYGEFKFDKNLIKKIELRFNGEDKILLTDVNKILECFNEDLVVRTFAYDVLATGGCNGIHWSRSFNLTFYSDDSKFTMSCTGCRGGIPATSISKDFVKYDNADIFKSLFFKYGHYFSADCNYEKLREVLLEYDEELLY